MAKRIRETAAGKSISATVVLRADGTHVATVQFHYANSGNVMCDVWHHGADNPTRKALDDAKDWGPTQRRAGGGGYDKATACLSGVEIDGHRLCDHCGERLAKPEGLDHFPADHVPPPGYRHANWRRAPGGGGPHPEGGWTDCYKDHGLRYLESIGYRVIQAI